MKTSAEKMKALRERREKQGLKRLEVWVHPDDALEVKHLSENLAMERRANYSQLGDAQFLGECMQNHESMSQAPENLFGSSGSLYGGCGGPFTASQLKGAPEIIREFDALEASLAHLQDSMMQLAKKLTPLLNDGHQPESFAQPPHSEAVVTPMGLRIANINQIVRMSFDVADSLIARIAI